MASREAARRPLLGAAFTVIGIISVGRAFVPPATAGPVPAGAVPVAQPQLRGSWGAQAVVPQTEPGTFGFSAPVASLLAVALAVVGMRQAVMREAKADKKKKGVRVVNGKEIPWNEYNAKSPLKCKVVANHKQPQTLTKSTGDPNWETCHITLDHGGKLHYLEGQSIGLIAPGPDKKGERPAKPRLYSIASSASGDDENSTTVSLCVKRLVEVDGKFANRKVGEDRPDRSGTAFPDSKVYRGVSSNFVCDLAPGDEVMVTGPTGAEMLLPEDQSANLVMLATGTGIAPMRSFLRLLFNDKAGANPDGSRKFRGTAWLFLGVPYGLSIMYDDEHQEYQAKFPDQFRYDYAISRNADGKKVYIQTKMAEYADELWNLLQKPNTHVYMCGLKGMEKGLQECFSEIAKEHDSDWGDFVKVMKKDHRYHMEVY